MKKFLGSLALSVALTIVLFSSVLADDYNVPITIDGTTYTVTISAERGRVITATVDNEDANVGEISLSVDSMAAGIVETNLADAIISGDFPEFPAGEPGEVSIVHVYTNTDSIGSGHLNFIVRNNTDKTIYGVRAEADLYDKAGEYLATEENIFVSFPDIVPPGGIAYNFVYFSSIEMSEGDEYEIFVDYDDEPGYSYSSDFLQIIDHKKSTRTSGVVGRLKNTSDSTFEEVKIRALCYDDINGALETISGDVNAEGLESGETARFSIVVDCDQYLLWASGK